MKVSIARALKEKSRLAGRIHTIQDVLNKENSQIVGSTRSVDIKALYAQIKELMERMVAIKAAIAKANGPVVGLLVELEEAKSMIGFLSKLNTDEAADEGSYNRASVKREAIIRQSDVLLEVDAYQQRVNALQDELDEFNVKTMVDIDIG